ncbi:MAG: DUF4250 domain-containing protein [Rikenellaceae bacterium]
MENIPSDPMMLFSFINTKLRDSYLSLSELCDDLGLEQADIIESLQSVGFEYNAELNKFW